MNYAIYKTYEEPTYLVDAIKKYIRGRRYNNLSKNIDITSLNKINEKSIDIKNLLANIPKIDAALDEEFLLPLLDSIEIYNFILGASIEYSYSFQIKLIEHKPMESLKHKLFNDELMIYRIFCVINSIDCCDLIPPIKSIEDIEENISSILKISHIRKLLLKEIKFSEKTQCEIIDYLLHNYEEKLIKLMKLSPIAESHYLLSKI